jgi:CRP/FNR family transcriptional regulator, cyclic AMP receptor protein
MTSDAELETEGELLEEVPFFKLLDDEERITLATMLEEVKIRAGQVLFRFGEPGDALYLVRSGVVELFSHDHGGNKIVLMHCGVGGFFGELSLLDGGPRTATAVVLEDAELLKLRRDELMLFLQLKPSAALNMLTVMGQRFRQTGELLRQRVTRNANEEDIDHRTFAERAADWMAEVAGSLPFLLAHLVFFAAWLFWIIDAGAQAGVNFFGRTPFDPFPFGLLAMTVSMEAIILSMFVLITQNRQAHKERLRSDIEYEINLKAELEVAYLHDKVDRMHADILARLQPPEKL